MKLLEAIATIFLIYQRLSAASFPATEMSHEDSITFSPENLTPDMVDTSSGDECLDSAPSPTAVRHSTPVFEDVKTPAPSEHSAGGPPRNTLGPGLAPEMDLHYDGFTAYVPFSSTTELASTVSDVQREHPLSVLHGFYDSPGYTIYDADDYSPPCSGFCEDSLEEDHWSLP
uniref:Putative secreted mucin n=1 Tax=Amblyomma triste TaxID=251400 RepID=A0A023G2M9_AMBTT